ncbi:bifunctional UDP-N-acetylglucosamine diphosphorylase/glucosamine-1-phosphate N-acetyltransferase GlmU [Rhodobacter sphaeroides]|jgi:UDP-N-acetylglucosamine pyrophosphorylase (EC 2.7.7.23)/glucosamine-1-phosphate N-acetyltransferase (EC 2.3.1.157)|uniref:Bifunctional protein GlmU n=1 Tax=Cereibacter sphaeroides (strain ATCC 17023 / DSM 158 / JCM 6121 / CCUG 31486 / LMG 2827 / NBRC 12203 / NCIMB 8253 / ATH 2.4.1.) TaxID=272943 RepID=GLMU_CERS4|nr:bifunctional UDP-N-acetylglucosamine diphosphorylase/glucosamine-1-phosphate N-acetyltransferase GlmU [Cereibacter sphaeroides]Q3J3H0.1 RecName: Full=Bifunctional protein GlmU; Includes: RecName: Full=UDP-N-acetylglucosamine pyrophosphorylase; AltName: Full=N-acetylglucosamine-1-phosphate uridyltransferase; Includes: RecName: Full=Glucosamine-1-phosphate N-acetyltransferase [Cereibacter sphaeroides 2.4.1]ABA78664.1 glucosamine-1-phosphate N-acetyltransferase; UDP-N-acetylglucosamine pyrophosph
MDRATVSLIVLAAGQGTRMNSDLPKVLHPLGAAPMLHHALRAGQSLEPERVVVVAGHGAEAVAKAARAFDESIEVVVQAEQLGTAHAVAQAAPLLADAPGEAVVLYGDTPFIRPETLERMLDLRSRHAVVVLGFEATDPGRYGRLVTRGEELDRIVEWKDATDEERTISLCNSGVICAEAGLLLALVSEVGNANAAGEYYLTDVVALARVRGLSAGVAICDEAETLGVNTRAQLAEAEAEFQKRARAAALEDGVTLTAPDTVFFALDTFLGRDAIVGPNVVFGPGVTVESGAEIRAFCHLEGCHISRGATVGPFARLRPGAELAEDVHVGNFVEIKNAVLDEGVKVGHLTYLGDAHVGEHTNIGAGTVTCNYDGVMKHRTEIGAHAFIGSDTMLVAPVTVGARAMTASGSVITENVPAEALALGRARQVTKPGMATRLMEMFRAAKAAKKKEAP